MPAEHSGGAALKNPPAITPRVLEVHPNRQGALRAFLTLQIGPLVIYRVRYIRQDGQRGYVAPPQEVVTGPGGDRKYLPVLKWPEEWKQPILDAAIAAVEESSADGSADRPTAFGAEVRRRASLPEATDETIF
ncbi:MAG: hypothetical protein ACRYFS_17350 [Janthinobacterium lividum]